MNEIATEDKRKKQQDKGPHRVHIIVQISFLFTCHLILLLLFVCALILFSYASVGQLADKRTEIQFSVVTPQFPNFIRCNLPLPHRFRHLPSVMDYCGLCLENQILRNSVDERDE